MNHTRRLTITTGVALLVATTIAATVLIAQQMIAPASAAAGSGEGDGRIAEADRVSVFADTPAVTNLDPALLAAVQTAATAAEGDGVRLQINSGWRSAAYQQELLADAVDAYGSAEEAARWVATPENSEHVSGDAVDLGPVDGQDWLTRNGAAFGLCQIYRNEPWHFELRPEAPANGCPLMYADPTADPRVRR